MLSAQLCQVHRFSNICEPTVLTALPVSYGFCGVGAANRQFHSTKQVHGTRIVPASSKTHWKNDKLHPLADGLYTASDQIIAVKTADCLPILIAHRKGFLVMALHAGWKGLASGIIQKAMDFLVTEHSILISELFVLIGPGISQAHFEVGPDVVCAFFGLSKIFDVSDKKLLVQASQKDHVYFNLPDAAALCLLRQGVHHEHISVMNSCTYKYSSMWHSFRREKKTLRHLNYTWINKLSA